MLRDTSLLYEIVTSLKENRFINHDNDTLVTDSQLKRINGFLDDLTIELFFKYATFKPIIITPEHIDKKYTSHGYVKLTKETELNINNPYDRYTFLKIISHPNFFKDIFPSNKCLSNLYCDCKKFGCYARCFIHKPDYIVHPYIEAFNQEFRAIDFDNNRAASLYCFRDFMRNFGKKCEYDINETMFFAERNSDYAAVKNIEVFEGVNLEYVLSIYCILVEKLIINHENMTPLVVFALDKIQDINHPLQLFHNFELKLPQIFNKEKHFDRRDVFLRFVNAEKSRAFNFKFNYPCEDYVLIRLFSEEEVTSVSFYNTLPLPYYQYKNLH